MLLDLKSTSEILISFALWWMLYLGSKLALRNFPVYVSWDAVTQYKARGLVPSTVFLLLIVPSSIWAIAYDDELKHMRVTGKTELSNSIIAVAAGYFMYDSLIVFWHLKHDGVAYLVHGVLCMFTYLIAVMYQVYQFYGPVFLLFESTTLFVNARWLLYELKMTSTSLYFYNGLALLLSWIFVRLVFGYTYSYFFWMDTLDAHSKKNLDFFIILWYTTANIGLNFLNTIWFFKILRGALRALRGKKA
uniref:TLC domain-containing protein n=1 Tax=Guillardia theta TaxID=55529 RepID=A0A7S4UZF6_GUITH|mmetsp:Transcript_5920/g.20888  ORF Transcript_5920/g.20888 Transcript_5920/m.20888 type:complete len:247 (+) Transcript_5920:118-858(+)